MRLERREAAVRVRNQPDPQACTLERAQGGRDVVVQLEVLAGRPLVVNLARARLQLSALRAHLLEDVTGIPRTKISASYAALDG